MKQILCVLLLLFSSRSIAAEFPLEIVEYFDRARLVIFVKEHDIEASPAWRPDQGAVPLTLETLVRRIKEWIDLYPRLSNLSITKIELKPVSRHEKRDRWYYLVQLRGLVEGEPEVDYLAVLLNGQILPAIREPDAYK